MLVMSMALTLRREALDEEEEKKEDKPPKVEDAPAAEADPIDEWGSFAPVGGKKKKGKKSKFADLEPEEPPPPPPEPEPVAAAEAAADDEWGMATTKKKKGKKGKVSDHLFCNMHEMYGWSTVLSLAGEAYLVWWRLCKLGAY